ncbi:MAG: serine/threonine-protein kinase [Methylobacter sp.]|jgi:serine/threonine protein kinase
MKETRVFETAFTTYTQVSVIGNGGTSQVFEVVDDEKCAYAIKLLNHSNTAKSAITKRFKNEIFFCQKNSHKNIVKVVNSGVFINEKGRFPFYVMPLYQSSLRSLIKAIIPENKILKYINQLLDGMEAAHLLGSVHRDIKPENILYDRKSDNLVVSDFGIAAFTEEQLHTLIETKEGTRLANFQYASPEQRMRDKNVDHRSDIYSIGLVINEMITGELAIGTSYKEVSSVISDLSYLDNIIRRMISQEPKDRFSSIGEVKKELIGRSEEFTILQRLNEERNRVIEFSEFDNPLLVEPNRIKSFDWKDNHLVLTLERAVDQGWINAFRNMGSFTSVLYKEPEKFSIKGNTASISATENEVQMIIDYFKQWLVTTHSRYVYMAHEERREEERKMREEQKIRIQKEEARLRIINNIKI